MKHEKTKLYLAVHCTKLDLTLFSGPYITMSFEDIVDGLAEDDGLAWDEMTVSIVEVTTAPEAMQSSLPGWLQ